MIKHSVHDKFHSHVKRKYLNSYREDSSHQQSIIYRIDAIILETQDEEHVKRNIQQSNNKSRFYYE